MTAWATLQHQAVVSDAPERAGSRHLIGFVLFEIACQLALISPIGGARTYVRAAALGSGLLMLLLIPGNARRHPAYGWAIVVMCVLVASIAHPMSDLPLAAPAQVALYLAVISPLFWVPRLTIRQDSLEAVFLALWAFHIASAVVGILQVLVPGSFQPPLSPVIQAMSPGYVSQLKIRLASGIIIFRPMGLTDIPGGAGASGSYAVLFGVGFFLTTRRPWMVAAAVGSMLAGITCLYLAQIRALVVMTGVSVIVLASVLSMRRDYRRLASVSIVLVVLVVVGFRTAASMVHDAVTARMSSLTTRSPGSVYYASRGIALEHTAYVLAPAYPLGAGLGRWGMMSGYFGHGNEPLWAELQWTGWLLDGGFPLILAYVFTVFMLLRTNWRLGRAPPASNSDSLHLWAAVLMGHSVGIVALTFSYPVFLSQTGMEFWLLSAALWTAMQVERTPRASAGNT